MKPDPFQLPLELPECRVDSFRVARRADESFDLTIEVVAAGTSHQIDLRGGRDTLALSELLSATSLYLRKEADGQLEFGSIELAFHDEDRAFHTLSFDAWGREA